MRFFAVIFTILISIVGSNFVVPEKVNAQSSSTTLTQVTEQDYVTLKGHATSFDDIWVREVHKAQNVPTVTFILLQSSPSKKYLEFLKNSYDQNKNKPNFTINSLEVEALNSFIVYLNEQIPKALDTDVTALKLILIDATEAFDGAVSAVQNEHGTITDNQDNQNLTNAEAKAEKAKAAMLPPKCQSIVNDPLSDCLDAGLAWIVTHTFLALAGWLLWITATVMNYAINVGILQFASWAPDTLYPIWLVVRQITSLFVVFAGLWLGFMYIIDKGDQFKKYIPTVVIFALFVNFSYPLTRTIIDVSNIISLNVYASTVGASTLEASAITVGADKTAGSLIMNKLGLIGIVDYATGSTKEGEGKLNSINSVGPALLAVAFILYAAWIFFIISALLVTRTAVLVFLIIASPLLFVDKIIPKLGEEAAKLRGIFIEMLFVGPVFTIMLALTLKFLEVFQSGPLSSAGAIGSASGDSAITMFFNMLMMLIMLHIMFKVTKATSGKIGEAVAGVTGKVGGMAVGGAVLGGAGMVGRATLGRAAAAARDSGWMQKAQGGAMGRHLYNLSDTFAKGAYDGRNSSVVKFGAQKLGTNFGMGGTKGREELAADHRTKLETHLGRVGVHRNNVYDADGNLVAEKGTINTSPDALAARQRIIDGAGSVFGSKQDNNDMKKQMNDANQKFALDEMSKLDTEKDKAKIDALLEKYKDDEKMKKKLADAFSKKLGTEFALLDDAGEKLAFINRLQSADPRSVSGATMNAAAGKLENSDAQKAINEYNSQATAAAKLEYFNKQTSNSKAAINEHNTNKAAEKSTKAAEAAAAVAATNAVAAEQARTTQAVTDLLAHFTATP